MHTLSIKVEVVVSLYRKPSCWGNFHLFHFEASFLLLDLFTLP